MENYSAIGRNDLWTHITWVYLKIIMLSEESQPQLEHVLCDITDENSEKVKLVRSDRMQILACAPRPFLKGSSFVGPILFAFKRALLSPHPQGPWL